MFELINLINYLILITILIFIFIKSDLLTYLILSEFIWIFVYCSTLVLGIPYDVIYLLALNILILILSGLEFALGLLIYYLF